MNAEQLDIVWNSRLAAEQDFQNGIRLFTAATNEAEYKEAELELDKARIILVLDFGYTLEQLADLADQA